MVRQIITLIVTKEHRAKEIGPMIKHLRGLSRQYVCQIQGRTLYRRKENKGYIIWEQPRVDSMAVFRQLNKLPWREMLSMVEKENLSAQVHTCQPVTVFTCNVRPKKP